MNLLISLNETYFGLVEVNFTFLMTIINFLLLGLIIFGLIKLIKHILLRHRLLLLQEKKLNIEKGDNRQKELNRSKINDL